MNILYSAMPLDKGKSGISNYMFNTLEEMLKHHKVTVIVLQEDLPLLKERFPSAEYYQVSNRFAKPLINMLWHLFVMPFIMDFSKYDFLFVPAANRRVICRSPIFSVGTVHDFSQFHIKAKYDCLRMFYIRHVVPHFLHRFSSIVAVSKSTKNDTVSFCGIPEDRISVLYNGFDSRIYRADIPKNQEMIKSKFGIKGKYILYISRIEHPGKNHLNLIKAYEQLDLKLTGEYELVFAGSLWSGAEKVREYAEKSRLKDRIIFTGFIDYKDMPQLYRCAALYAFPSFFEGFGIPLVEAMACAVPCVCSNCSSLAEIAEGAALTFNPAAPDDIAEKITRVLNDGTLTSQMAAKGLEKLPLFNWERHVKGIIEAYDKKKSK